MPTVELVYDEGCPSVAEARARLLRAFAESKMDSRWQEWRGGDVTAPPRVRGRGSPTILVDGEDVDPPSGRCEGPSCRLYAAEDGALHGVPDVAVIARALMAAAAGEDGRAPSGGGSWTMNVALLPGIGAAFLPKVACPACWPAYAGFLGSVGLGFLLDASYLLPLTAVFLAGAVGALTFRASRRRGYKPFFVGMVAAVAVLIGKFAFESDVAMYVGLALLIGASTWNTWPRRRDAPACPACAAGELDNQPLG